MNAARAGIEGGVMSMNRPSSNATCGSDAGQGSLASLEPVPRQQVRWFAQLIQLERGCGKRGLEQDHVFAIPNTETTKG